MAIFKDIIGNEAVKKRLELLYTTNKLPHLLLFCGQEGVGKKLFAEKLAKNWLQNKDGTYLADLYTFSPEGKTGMHSIQAARRLIEEVHLAPFSSEKKVFIIDDAERMLPTSANALLKTLEEPPKNTLIILISSAPEKLLATIISRCQTIRFCPLTDQEVAAILIEKQKIAPDEAQKLAKCAHGSITKAFQEEDALESTLFLHLSQKRAFHEIAHIAKEFQKKLDAKRKSEESELRKSASGILKDANAGQRAAIEQEIEGALSLLAMQEVNAFFYIIQGFFLDLQRLQENLPLHFESQRQNLLQAQNRKLSFEHVLQAIQQAKQAIERSSSIQNALEGLLLFLSK